MTHELNLVPSGPLRFFLWNSSVKINQIMWLVIFRKLLFKTQCVLIGDDKLFFHVEGRLMTKLPWLLSRVSFFINIGIILAAYMGLSI